MISLPCGVVPRKRRFSLRSSASSAQSGSRSRGMAWSAGMRPTVNSGASPLFSKKVVIHLHTHVCPIRRVYAAEHT